MAARAFDTVACLVAFPSVWAGAVESGRSPGPQLLAVVGLAPVGAGDGTSLQQHAPTIARVVLPRRAKTRQATPRVGCGDPRSVFRPAAEVGVGLESRGRARGRARGAP